MIDRATSHALAITTGGPLSPNFVCSGTLIAPGVVLTARQCIARFPSDRGTCSETFSAPGGSPRDLWVTAEPSILGAKVWKHVLRWVVPEPAEICGNDIVLLVLDDIFNEKQATPARPVIDAVEFQGLIGARAVGIAGFGATSPSGAGGGKRNSRFGVPVVCVPGDLSFECAGLLDSVAFGELTTGAGPCVGDSGAGAMSNGDRGVILGVLARGDTEAGRCGAGAFERTDVWGWLIAKTVVEASFVDPPPVWATAAFPEHPGLGERCRRDECNEGATCISLDGRRSYVCAKKCSAGCDDDFHCESGVCIAGAAPDLSGGCSISGAPAAGGYAAWIAMGFATLGAALRLLRGRRDRAREGDDSRTSPSASTRRRRGR